MNDTAKALQENWEKMGREEPYWSVLTSPAFKSAVMTDQGKNEFYDSGAAEVHTMLDFLRRADIKLPKAPASITEPGRVASAFTWPRILTR